MQGPLDFKILFTTSQLKDLSEKVLLVDWEPVGLSPSQLPLDPTIQEGRFGRGLLKKVKLF